MSKPNKLQGMKFGKLVVLSRAGSDSSGKALWRCKCDCGKETIVNSYRLTSGQTQSCGCKKFESHNKKHGMTKTDIHNKWIQMRQRCLNKNNSAYKDYGARGITVCDQWNEFENFLDWSIKNGYCKGLSLDRIDNSKGYSPDNCRWVEWKEQANNRRRNILINYNGEIKPLKKWCSELNVSYYLIRNRIVRLGYTFEEAIKYKPRQLPPKSI